MPVYFTDGRKGLTLISKDYEGAYMMHYRTPGSKNGRRLYQYKDGSLTPLGRIHYGIGQKLKKSSDKPRTSWSDRFYPPELRGKSKEEKKAWEQAEKKKFESYMEKEKQEREFGKKLKKFDKLSPEEKFKVASEAEQRVVNLKNKSGLTHDERKTLDGLDDWLQIRNEQKEKGQILVLGDKEYSVKDMLKKDVNKELMDSYERARNEAGKTGGENGDKRIAYIDSLSDGPEKAKEIEKIIEESDNYLRRNHEIFAENRKDSFSWSEARRILDIKDSLDPKHYERNATDSWLFNQILSKSGDWYNTTGKSKGFKKITNEINRLQEESDKIYNQIFEGAKFDDYADLNKKYNKDPRVIQMKSRIDELTKQMPEQVLKDLGVPVTKENLAHIEPYVFWD